VSTRKRDKEHGKIKREGTIADNERDHRGQRDVLYNRKGDNEEKATKQSRGQEAIKR